MTQLTESEHKAQMEDMAQFDEQMPCVGIFWYDTEEHNFFGVCKQELTPKMVEDAAENGLPFINYPKLHRQIWAKEYFRAQATHEETKFKGDYTQIPRGRVAWNIDKFIVLVGHWADPIQDELTELLVQEFSLPYFEFVYDEHLIEEHLIMEDNEYYLKKEFISYLKNDREDKLSRPDQKAGYIVSIRRNVLEKIGCEILINDIEKAFQYKRSYNKVFDGLGAIYSFLKKLVWIKNNMQNNEKITTFLKKYQLNENSINNWPSVIGDYKIFLANYSGIKPKTTEKYRYNVTLTGWNDAIKNLKEEGDKILSIKGTDSLLSKFKDEKSFIKEVLSNSYFFSPKLAMSRFKKIAEAFKKGEELYARKSTDDKIQKNNYFLFTSEINNSTSTKQMPIIVDKDGNTKVKELIKDETGYTVSAGYDCNFQYCIISHIWGDAFDPRNFTNYWNLAIVPAWANFLLDKQGSQDDFTRKFINTFKAICIAHYNMKNMKWADIDKSFNNLQPDGQIEIGSYTINVIMGRGKKQDYGKIEQTTITI